MREQWTPERIAEVRAELSDLLNTPEREIEHPAPVQRAAGLGLTLAAALKSQQAELDAARQLVTICKYDHGRDAECRSVMDALRTCGLNEQAMDLERSIMAYDAARAGQEES